LKTMLAARLVEIGKPLELVQMPIPAPQAGEVLVRVRATGICSSDLHYQDGKSKVTRLPLTLGHEIAGEVVETGDGVTEFSAGDRVCLFYLVTCGRCLMCTTGRDNYCPDAKMLGKNIDGGFAEYLCVPARNLFKLPDEIPYTHGALLGDAVATPFHALSRAGVKTGDNVLVIGIGGLGLHAIQIARIMGAAQVIAADISPEKLALAKKVGATAALNPQNKDFTDRINAMTGKGVDVAIELIGLPQTIRTAIDLTGIGGKIVIVGICPEDVGINPYHDLLLKEKTIMGSADQSREDFPVIIDLAARGRINLDHSVSHELSLEEINRGLEMLRRKEDNPVRIMITQEK